MATEADERHWREAMEKLGVETVRAKLAYGHAGQDRGADVMGTVGQPPYPSRAFVEAWLADQEIAEAGIVASTRLILVFAAIAAAMGIVTAVLGILALRH